MSALIKSLAVSIDAGTFPGAIPKALLSVSSIDILAALTMLGTVTIPNGFSVASPALYWAWMRYFSALSSTRDLRITSPFADLDPHQKGILSDDFGVAVSTQWLYQAVGGFKSVVDGRRFVLHYRHLLTKPMAEPTKIGPAKCPDFVICDSAGKWHIVECKGTQTSRSLSKSQLERARQQKAALVVDPSMAGYRLATGLFLISDNEPSEASAMTVQDPEEASPLVRVDDEGKASRVSNRLTASRGLGLAGFTEIGEELAFVEMDVEHLRRLLTTADIQRERIPPAERVRRLSTSFDQQRTHFIEQGRDYVGRSLLIDVRLAENNYASRPAKLTHGVASDYIDDIRSHSRDELVQRVDSRHADNDNDDLKVESNDWSVKITQNDVFVTTVRFE